MEQTSDTIDRLERELADRDEVLRIASHSMCELRNEIRKRDELIDIAAPIVLHIQNFMLGQNMDMEAKHFLKEARELLKRDLPTTIRPISHHIKF